MVVGAALRRALSVAARPGGHIDREDGRVAIGQVAGEQVAQPVGVDPAAGQGGIGAAPAASVDWFQAQVRQRRDRLGAQQGVAQLEQRVGAAGEAGVQLTPEHVEPRKARRWLRHGRAA
jgi:hypothetical protein